MKTLSALAIAFAFIAATFGSCQTTYSATLAIKQIPINIEFQRGSDDFKDTPQPGCDVTLLMSQKVHFAWDSSKGANIFVIQDETGKKIFEATPYDESSLDINPVEANLHAGKKYSWSVDGNKTVYTFKVLDEQTEKKLLDTLAVIDAEGLSPDKCRIKKAAYVQELSDDPSNNLDLYWLSAQWLVEIDIKDDEQLRWEKDYLLEECSEHILMQLVEQ